MVLDSWQRRQLQSGFLDPLPSLPSRSSAPLVYTRPPVAEKRPLPRTLQPLGGQASSTASLAGERSADAVPAASGPSAGPAFVSSAAEEEAEMLRPNFEKDLAVLLRRSESVPLPDVSATMLALRLLQRWGSVLPSHQHLIGRLFDYLSPTVFDKGVRWQGGGGAASVGFGLGQATMKLGAPMASRVVGNNLQRPAVVQHIASKGGEASKSKAPAGTASGRGGFQRGKFKQVLKASQDDSDDEFDASSSDSGESGGSSSSSADWGKKLRAKQHQPLQLPESVLAKLDVATFINGKKPTLYPARRTAIFGAADDPKVRPMQQTLDKKPFFAECRKQRWEMANLRDQVTSGVEICKGGDAEQRAAGVVRDMMHDLHSTRRTFWTFVHWRQMVTSEKETRQQFLKVQTIETGPVSSLKKAFVMFQLGVGAEIKDRFDDRSLQMRREGASAFAQLRRFETRAAELAAESEQARKSEELLQNRLDRRLGAKNVTMARLDVFKPHLLRQILLQAVPVFQGSLALLDGLERCQTTTLLRTRQLLQPNTLEGETLASILNTETNKLILRWVNQILSEAKLAASGLLENYLPDGRTMSTWSTKDTPTFRQRCRLVRAIPVPIKNFGQDLSESVELVALVAMMRGYRNGVRFLDPVDLWPLDQRSLDVRAERTCDLLHGLAPHRAVRCLLTPADITDGNEHVLRQFLAAVFLADPPGPRKIDDARAVETPKPEAQADNNKGCELDSRAGSKITRSWSKISRPSRTGSKISRQVSISIMADEELSRQVMADPKMSRQVNISLLADEDDDDDGGSKLDQLGLTSDSDILGQLRLAALDDEDDEDAEEEEGEPPEEVLARALEDAAQGLAYKPVVDLSPLLNTREPLESLREVPPPDFLLRWLNFQIQGGPLTAAAATGSRRISAVTDRLRARNFNEDLSDGKVLLALMRRVAGDIVEESEDHNEDAAEIVSEHSARCANGFHLAVDAIRSSQEDQLLAFVGCLFLTHPRMSPEPRSELAAHVKFLSELSGATSTISTDGLSNAKSIGSQVFNRFSVLLASKYRRPSYVKGASTEAPAERPARAERLMAAADCALNNRKLSDDVSENLQLYIAETFARRARAQPVQHGAAQNKDAATTRYAFQEVVRSEMWLRHLWNENPCLLGHNVRNLVRAHSRFLADTFLFYGVSSPSNTMIVTLVGVMKIYSDCRLGCKRLNLSPWEAEKLFYQVDEEQRRIERAKETEAGVQGSAPAPRAGLDEFGFLKWVLRAALKRQEVKPEERDENEKAAEVAGTAPPPQTITDCISIFLDHMQAGACKASMDAFDQTARDPGVKMLMANHESLFRTMFEAYAHSSSHFLAHEDDSTDHIQLMFLSDFQRVLQDAKLLEDGKLDEEVVRRIFAQIVKRRATVFQCESTACAGSACPDSPGAQGSSNIKRAATGLASETTKPRRMSPRKMKSVWQGGEDKERRARPASGRADGSASPVAALQQMTLQSVRVSSGGLKRGDGHRGTVVGGALPDKVKLGPRGMATRRWILREPAMMFEDFLDGILAAMWFFDPSPLTRAGTKVEGFFDTLIRGLTSHWSSKPQDPDEAEKEKRLVQGLLLAEGAKTPSNGYVAWSQRIAKTRLEAVAAEAQAKRPKRPASAPAKLMRKSALATAGRSRRGSRLGRRASRFSMQVGSTKAARSSALFGTPVHSIASPIKLRRPSRAAQS